MQNATDDVEKMILGNKCDLEQLRAVSTEKGKMVSSYLHLLVLSMIA
jgi:hypothetical protein